MADSDVLYQNWSKSAKIETSARAFASSFSLRPHSDRHTDAEKWVSSKNQFKTLKPHKSS